MKNDTVLPNWVWNSTTLRTGYVTPRPHDTFGSFLVYGGIFIFLLIASGFVILVLNALSFLVNGYWAFAAPASASVILWIMRRLAFRWIRMEWRCITGEKDLEPYLVITEYPGNGIYATLKNVGLRYNYWQPGEDFRKIRMACDIAGIYQLCHKGYKLYELRDG